MAFAEPMYKTTAYFGTDIQGHGQVKRDTFQTFLREHVDTKYDGYTLQEAKGVWLGQKETCYIVTIFDFTEQQARLTGHNMATVAQTYKKEFYQDSVLLIYEEVKGLLI